MIKIEKKNIAKKVGISALVLGLMVVGASVTHAAMNSPSSVGPITNLVTAISQKFNLDPVEVQKVFDEQKSVMEKDRVAQEALRLQQAVTDGKLTQDQADKIIAKKSELESIRTNLVGKTKTERMTLMKNQMDSLKQWMADNKIPQEFMMPGFVGHGKHKRGDNFGHNNMMNP